MARLAATDRRCHITRYRQHVVHNVAAGRRNVYAGVIARALSLDDTPNRIGLIDACPRGGAAHRLGGRRRVHGDNDVVSARGGRDQLPNLGPRLVAVVPERHPNERLSVERHALHLLVLSGRERKAHKQQPVIPAADSVCPGEAVAIA